MTKKTLTVGFLTSSDPNDKTSWSGISYQMLKHLEKHGLKVIALGPIKKPKILSAVLLFFDMSHILFGKRYNKSHNIISSKYYAWHFKKKLNDKNIDMIFAPCASIEIAYLKTSIPICYLSGTSFDQINNYYSVYSNLSRLSINESNLIEKRAIENSVCQVYPSEWAASHVINYYNAEKDNVFIIKYGASFNQIPEKIDVIEKYKAQTLNLLFVGVDWKRKGGDIVLETFKILLSKGYDVNLTICGCAPPESHPKMTVIPFLNKNIDSDNQRLIQLYLDSHIFFLPTRGECFGVVFCEAAAFGLPIITTDTGGVTSAIESGANGIALPLDATADHYALTIKKLIDTPNKLKKMAILSREKFERELNWDAWAKKIVAIFLITIKNKNT